MESVLIFSFCSITEKRRSARFRRRSFSSRDLKDLHDGKEIYETLTQASDPDSVKVSVLSCISVVIYDYRMRRHVVDNSELKEADFNISKLNQPYIIHR